MPGRLFIRNRDIMNITGLKLRAAQRLVSKVRKAYNKNSSDPITRDEFCAVFKIDPESINDYLQF